jgi:hypothetical protein
LKRVQLKRDQTIKQRHISPPQQESKNKSEGDFNSDFNSNSDFNFNSDFDSDPGVSSSKHIVDLTDRLEELYNDMESYLQESKAQYVQED